MVHPILTYSFPNCSGKIRGNAKGGKKFHAVFVSSGYSSSSASHAA
jgi:hypothetical protein